MVSRQFANENPDQLGGIGRSRNLRRTRLGDGLPFGSSFENAQMEFHVVRTRIHKQQFARIGEFCILFVRGQAASLPDDHDKKEMSS